MDKIQQRGTYLSSDDYGLKHEGEGLISRRYFIITGSTAVGGLLLGCGTDPLSVEPDDALLPPEDLARNAKYAGTSKPYRVSISSPTKLLLKGQLVTIKGRVLDSSGKPLKNEGLGVYDGLTLVCAQTTTDKNGNISYNATANVSGAAVVEFIVRGTRFPFLFQAATKVGSVYKASPLYLSGLAIRNTSSEDIKAITSVHNGTSYTHRVPKKKSQTILWTVVNQAIQRVTVFGGLTFSVGLGAGVEYSATVDSNQVGTFSGAAGAGPIRGQVYATTANDLGVCWAPGGNFGVTPASVSGEIALCGGTDGISVGASGETGGVTGGFSIQLVKW